MSGASSRRRGADAERAVVAYLRQHGWPDARRYLAGDGRQPGDVDVWPGICIEVKDRAGSAWPTWREQAVREARPGDLVVVVRRQRGIPDAGQWETHIPRNDWYWLGGSKPANADVVLCPRLHSQPWVRTTFAAIVDLVTAANEADSA